MRYLCSTNKTIKRQKRPSDWELKKKLIFLNFVAVYLGGEKDHYKV